ncbi:MAG: hypothetical protein K0S00_1262 [Xanthobacteraceae bacterium]|jgi:hypothetical protein|nr:hypothetical protein [Xanthobacteraceae bacterium]
MTTLNTIGSLIDNERGLGAHCLNPQRRARGLKSETNLLVTSTLAVRRVDTDTRGQRVKEHNQ